MVNDLPKEMRAARRPRLFGGTTEGWYYINPKSIDVYAHYAAIGTSVRLTRRQLEQALKIMDTYSERG